MQALCAVLAGGRRWAVAPQYIDQFKIVLSIFRVSAPTIQRDCPTMLQAVFQATIVSNAETVLFNTELVSKALPDQQSLGGAEHVFAPTPPMSTYLVGIVVGDLQKQEIQVEVDGEVAGSKRQLPVAVHSRIGSEGRAALALHSAAAAVQGATQWFP